MRFMVLVKANKDSEAGVLPDEKILTDEDLGHLDRDFHVLGPERSEAYGFEHHRLVRRLGNPCHRVPHSGTWLDWTVAGLLRL